MGRKALIIELKLRLWLDKLLGKAERALTPKLKQPSPSPQPKFEFSVLDYNKIGDQYDYRVEASTREAAQRALIEYFFGRPLGASEREYNLTSSHQTVCWPGHCGIDTPRNNVFSTAEGFRFARLVSGQSTTADRVWLTAKAERLGITLSNR